MKNIFAFIFSAAFACGCAQHSAPTKELSDNEIRALISQASAQRPGCVSATGGPKAANATDPCTLEAVTQAEINAFRLAHGLNSHAEEPSGDPFSP